MLPITEALRQAIEVPNPEPSLVMKIDGYPYYFGSVILQEYIRIGDPGLEIGNDWVIGGLRDADNQKNYITFSSGTTPKVQQKLDVWKAQGSTVTSMTIALVDKDEEITLLASPGFELEDIIGRDVTVYTAVTSVAFPEDYNIIFRGVIQRLGSVPGVISFTLSNTEEKKRASIMSVVTSKIPSDIFAADTSITIEDASEFFTPVDCLTPYAVIDRELISYTGISTNTLTGVTRGLENSVAEDYEGGEEIERWIKLTGNGLDLALKLMLSQGGTNYIENYPIRAFYRLDLLTEIPGAIFFADINIEEEYGVAVGDTVVISGASNAGNNITSTVSEVGFLEENGASYVVLNDDVILENPTTATANFQSPWNVLPIGLGMHPKEVDVKQHLYVRDTFWPVFTLEVFMKESEDTKIFIESELYKPMACFSVPRKGRSSVVTHAPPLVSYDLKEMTDTTVKNAPNLSLERSIVENFFNQVDYNFDFFPPDEKMKTTKSFESTKSKERIPKIGNRILNIDSRGLRTASGGDIVAEKAAIKFLKRYQFGAEFIKNMDIHFKTGYALEIGDIVEVNFDGLIMSNYGKGRRGSGSKLFEVQNKVFDSKTGQQVIDLVNTAFGINERYGVISPSSLTAPGSTVSKLKIKRSYTTPPFRRESSKWRTPNYRDQEIIVHNEDWTTVYTTHIRGFDNLNPQGMLIDPIPLPPGENWIIQSPVYPDVNDQNELKFWKQRHAFFSPQVQVTATVLGHEQTRFEVSPADIGKFFIGSQCRIHNYDYTDDTFVDGETEPVVVNIFGNMVEIDTPAGFTIDSTHFIDLIGFPDEQHAYRIL